MKSKKLTIAIFLVFISGGIIGFVGGFRTCNNRWRSNMQKRRSSSMMGKRLIDRFQNELKLTEDQVEQMKPVFTDFFKKQRAIDKQYHPQKIENLHKLMKNLKQFLTPRQLEKMKRLEENRQKFFGKRDVKGPSRNGGPRKHDDFRRPKRDGSGKTAPPHPPRHDNELSSPPPQEN